MKIKTMMAVAATAALALTACGGDDDDTAVDEPEQVDESDVTVSADSDSGDSGDASTAEAPEVPAGDADGTGTFQAGDLTIEGDVVACSLDGNDVNMSLNGENAGVEVFSVGGGQAGIAISGVVEWAGQGMATVDGGSVTITGAGSLTDPDAPVEDFTLTATIGAC